ncbi:polycystic kidney disease 2-like 2 protein [Macrosteles quadrilineatus]|uniref:polycystic kidney disease 2-like 2 protein n=1 Tax=Macrosteles quadrilineatus TaxID=74068 RepID=UPI0023E098BA|nr:polycystic kidney disease 2-like 2 protein [Macrosteles quadrilineatus]
MAHTSHGKHDDDVTKTFLSALSTTREIRQPIEVREGRKPLPRTADEYEIVYNPETDKDHPYEKWRRNPILRCLVTREIARYLDRRTFITVSVREAIIYCIFLILITIITFGSTPLDMFYFSQAMATLYTKQKFPVEMSRDEDPISIDFYQINTLEHIWFYQNAILDKLFHSFWYTKPDPYASPENTQEYFYENKLIGSPQIRQIRVKNSTCSTVDAMKHMIQTCYGPYTEANEEKGQIGLITSATAKQNLEWNSPDKTGSMSISGSLATYSGGGYVAILSRHGDDATQLLLQLKSLKWYDRATRALFIEFTIYNGNVNLFCIFKLIFEMPPTGGVIPNHWNYVQKLIRYNDSYDFFVLGCEVVFTIFFLFFTLQKLLEIKTLKSKVFRTFWNYIDLMVLIVSVYFYNYGE